MPKSELQRRIDDTNQNSGTTTINLGGVGSGVTDHGALTGLADDDHTIYVHVSSARTISVLHTFNNSGAPFAIGAAASGNLVTGLNADLLDGQHGSYYATAANLTTTQAEVDALELPQYVVLAATSTLTNERVLTEGTAIDITDGGAGSTVTIDVDVAALIGTGLSQSGDTIILPEPDTITVSTANVRDATGHTHDITHSSNPGAVATILSSNSDGKLQLEGLGLGVAPAATHLLRISGDGAAAQMRIDHTGGNRALFTVDSNGSLTLEMNGDAIFDPDGDDVRPATTYAKNLGTASQRWLALYAAELFVQTLVAQDVLSTIGGRILVGPTTELIAAVNNSQTTIDVKHNQIASGDIVYLQTAPGGVAQLEAMKITSSATTITGGYRYDVTRNFDSSGANSWEAGDAVFNTGNTGDGFIDIFAEQGVHGSGAGPTIVGNTRDNNTTWPGFSEHWAVGNLNSLYDYSTNTFGLAAGDHSAAWVAADETNGIRINNSSENKFNVDANGHLKMGRNTANAADTAVVIASGALTHNSEALTAGDILIWDNSAGQPNMLFDESDSKVKFRSGTLTKVTLDTDGFKAGNIQLDDSGLSADLITGIGESLITTRGLAGNTINEFLLTHFTNTERKLTVSVSGGADTAGTSRITITPSTDTVSSSNFTEIFLESDQGDTNKASISIQGESVLNSKVSVTGEGNFSGVLITPPSVSTNISADTWLHVQVSGNGEGIKVDNGFIGRGALGSNSIQFSHWDHRNSSTDYGYIQNSAGRTIINTASGQQGTLRQNGTNILTWESGSVAIVASGTGEGLSAGVGFLGIGSIASQAFFSHTTHKSGSTGVRVNSSGQIVINTSTGQSGLIRNNETTIISWTGSLVDITADVDISGDTEITGDLSVVRSGSPRTGYIYVPLSTLVTVFNNVSRDNDSLSQDNAQEITAATLGVPGTAKAVQVRLLAAIEVENDSWPGTPDQDAFFSVGPSSTEFYDVGARPAVEGSFSGSTPVFGLDVNSGVCRCSSSGSIYYKTNCPEDGSTPPPNKETYTLHTYLQVMGYWV